jgi:hypothetical protein
MSFSWNLTLEKSHTIPFFLEDVKLWLVGLLPYPCSLMLWNLCLCCLVIIVLNPPSYKHVNVCFFPCGCMPASSLTNAMFYKGLLVLGVVFYSILLIFFFEDFFKLRKEKIGNKSRFLQLVMHIYNHGCW